LVQSSQTLAETGTVEKGKRVQAANGTPIENKSFHAKTHGLKKISTA
jgi:hypothetical protein